MRLPDFLVIGAMKCGTTALYYYLDQHPEVYMSPVKEPDFLAFEGEGVAPRNAVTDLSSYAALFREAGSARAVGEASHESLYRVRAVENIRRYVPGARFIAVLRDPADRAYSHYLHLVRNGTEPLPSFEAALAAERRGDLGEGFPFRSYVDRGFYLRQLSRYYKAFGEERLRVYLYEDLATRPLWVMRDAFAFIGVDPGFVPDVSLRRNVSGVPRSRLLDALLQRQSPLKNLVKTHLPSWVRRRVAERFDRLKSWNLTKPQPMHPETRRELVETYREDIMGLQGLIRRDLSGWLRC
ncbi:hypothetical protein Rxycam_00884 [Rubrobacter xylanophilus DSM 9941]|uniref:sulfotransferase family protein n=1 Tax=Rubrobacter xylanophilus TaxID=49319 RepID=UPI001C63C483|nr:sulfotransferase [Rubrobacter xylanophilus]QYJ15072.1 hypothetical protein Rxycam_00884 [Rubrobacter xylanophilus DSM 9941]